MMVITGATGHLGKATINFLLKKGVAPGSITAFVRDEHKAGELKASGVVVRVGDYDNYTSMENAFRGADKLLLISGSDVMRRGKQQQDAVRAAKEAGVKYILYTSFERKDETEKSPIALVAKAHIDTETNIKTSGIAYTIFRNSIYMDFIPMFIGEKALETGIYFPAGDGKVAFALRDEMAEAIANVLATGGHEGKEYIIAGHENVSFQDLAQTLTAIAGKHVPYISPEAGGYTSALTNAGVPAEYVSMFAAFAEAMKRGEFAIQETDLPQLLGRQPAVARQYLERVYSHSPATV